jgi:hypothetical protein
LPFSPLMLLADYFDADTPLRYFRH